LTNAIETPPFAPADRHHDRATLDFYEANARPYAEARLDAIAPDLPPFLARLERGCRILELGCGSGHDAAAMQALGFDVDATDGTPAMAALASEQLGRPARVLRFDALDASEAYDAVIAHAALLHVSPGGLPAILTRIWTALRPGGWHFASYKTGATPGWDAHGRYYNYPSREQADEMYRAAGAWADLCFEEYDGTGYFGAPARWLSVAARKQSSG
jgi:SAM-dependent methyltransferase